ncbi:hypothetical protein BD414DRAFT_498768, partial [Trametes punicea]
MAARGGDGPWGGTWSCRAVLISLYFAQEESSARLARFAAECAAAYDDASGSSKDTCGPRRRFGRFVLLDRGRYDLSQMVTVLGCTLWARLDADDLDVLRRGVTDFRRIEGFDPAAYQVAHARDAAWLAEAVAEVEREKGRRRVVVMTHHAPTVEGTGDPRYVGGATSSAFATEMVGSAVWPRRDLGEGADGEGTRGAVRVWMFGHTHWCCDFVREGVRVVSNPRGYREGAPGFTPEKVVEV